MTTVQQKRLLILGVAATVVGISGCKKYPDGPAFSLKSKKARLVGEWELEDGPGQMGNSEVFFEFDDDGDFTVTSEYNYAGYSYSYSYDGEWEFSGDKEELEIEVDGDRIDFEILRLTNEELFLEDPNNEEYEFEKQ